MSDQDKERAEAAEETEAIEEETVETEHDHDHDHDHEHAHGEGEEKPFEFVEDPVFDIEYKGACAYEVKVSVSAANEKKMSGELFDELQHEAQVPGFRKGRAPRKLLEKKYGKAIRGDVTEKLVSAAFRKLIDDNNLKPIHTPDVEGLEGVMERPEDAPLEFELKFEVGPRCELGKYRGIEVERLIPKVTEADVNEVIDNMRERYALYENCTDGAAQKGDQVIISFKGEIDGEAFAGGSAENYPYILGSGRFFAEFEAALEGAKPGEEVHCDVTFPEDYSAAHLAGKTAQFTIDVKELKRKTLPEMDDAFAQQTGAKDLADIREKVEKDLFERIRARFDAEAEEEAVDKIVADSTIEVPSLMVEQMMKANIDAEVKRLTQMRIPMPEIEAAIEERREQFRESAIQEIKRWQVVNEIGIAEGIEVTEADFEREAESLQERTGMEKDVISQFLAQYKESDSYERRIFRRKALDLIMENAVVTEREITLEENDKETAANDS
jgi:trigger factor